MTDGKMIKRVRISRMRIAVVAVVTTLLLLSSLLLYVAGCTDTLKGDEYTNEQPIVYFASIPPEGQRTGRNLVVYWYGTDRDGLIGAYRYYVVPVAEVGQQAPEDYILTVPDSEWTYVTVDPKGVDPLTPQTAHAIPLVADRDDPVNVFVSQWVFLQAFDLEGLGSEIVFRQFSRNDNPPETHINDFAALLPFVDGDSGGTVAGVTMVWGGSDSIDYPRDPPIEYQWRVYGPYNSADFQRLSDNYIDPVFVTSDSLYRLGETFISCDTLPDTIRCTTFVVTSTTGTNRYGSLQTKLFVDDPGFIGDDDLNKVADSSYDGEDAWISRTSTTVYNVYRHYAEEVAGKPEDTTVQMTFIFWVRSRDDALVADLVPAFASFPVIRARFERPVAVYDFTGFSFDKYTLPDLRTSRAPFWYNAVHTWNPNLGDTGFDTTNIALDHISPDYIDVPQYQSIPLAMLLKHKVAILYDDNIINSSFISTGAGAAARNVYKAIDAGVNVWLIMRASLNTGDGASYGPQWDFIVPPFSNYWWYFGVTRMVYSGWLCHAVGTEATGGCGPPYQTACERDRIEDFIGTYALKPDGGWPDLEVDTTYLRTRYDWKSGIQTWSSCVAYDPDYPALPEVDWSGRLPTTEALYLYKSLYTDSLGGANHPRGGNYDMEGNPVAHRYNTGMFRTAHFNFSPLAIDSAQMQVVVDSMLNWLSETGVGPLPASGVRYPDAPVQISVSEARERYLQRVAEETGKEEMRVIY